MKFFEGNVFICELPKLRLPVFRRQSDLQEDQSWLQLQICQVSKEFPMGNTSQGDRELLHPDVANGCIAME